MPKRRPNPADVQAYDQLLRAHAAWRPESPQLVAEQYPDLSAAARAEEIRAPLHAAMHLLESKILPGSTPPYVRVNFPMDEPSVTAMTWRVWAKAGISETNAVSSRTLGITAWLFRPDVDERGELGPADVKQAVGSFTVALLGEGVQIETHAPGVAEPDNLRSDLNFPTPYEQAGGREATDTDRLLGAAALALVTRYGISSELVGYIPPSTT